MFDDILALGYSIRQIPPYTLIYRTDMPHLPDLVDGRDVLGSETRITGRSAIRVIEPDLVVRPLTHGGLLRKVTKNRFLSLERSLREIRTSAYLLSQGVPTPEIAAVRFMKQGLFYFINVITRRVPGSVDLLTWLEGAPTDAPARLEQAGALIRRLHDLGVYHFDLHVKNILLDEDFVCWIIDLDNAYGFQHLPTYLKQKNVARFKRSLRKWDAKGRISLPPGWEQAFMNGYDFLG